jgi:cathepsin L
LDDVTSLPTEVDWDKEGKVNLAPGQGGCGSCWVFASTAAIESHLAIVTGDDPILLSQQNILQCAPNPLQCGGKFSTGLIHIIYCN